ncbi:MAG: hydantoinase B/oxoprolinase family protein [Geminicoccaceae bacterium]|nr:MAG: hydantoinase B/oxoprolinase family protein [Geminicoccaceae bacterium]
MTELGVVERQIIWDRLVSVVEEQAQVLLRTAFSTIVRECGDLSAGVFDVEGRMLAQAVTGTPGHVNSMAESVKHFIAAFPPATMQEGDAFITNDPWKGTGHLNDFVVTTPAFLDGKLVGYFSCTSHLTDIGGIGFGPDATDVHMEGIALPFLKVVDRGEVNRTLIEICKANSRLPVEMEGDIYSLIACNDVGVRRLEATMREFGLTDLDAIGAHIIQTSRQAVLKALAEVPAGTYRYAMTIDGYDRPIELKAAVTVGPEGVVVDFDGTSPQAARGINVPLAYTTAYTCFGLMCALSPRVPNNAGSLGCFTVTAPPGTILNARYPAPVSSRHITGQMLPDVVFGALRQAIPERCPAEGTSCLWNMTFRGPRAGNGDDRYGFAITVTSNGGTGARPTRDGLNATAYPSGVKGTPVEIVEAMTPLLFWKKELRPGSGGEGTHRGGHGQIIEVENGDGLPFELLAAFDRIRFPPRGAEGGAAGAAGGLTTSKGRTLAGKGFQKLDGDERLTVLTPGGGGWGDPAARTPRLREQDRTTGLEG